ncbi:MAG TPA: calcium/sodium antiporter [Patescibacteria group bacterium]|nr:calcium/sodium antiporter [Patescibacteria group bacterium]
MLTYLLLIIGFIALIKGADWLVEGASSIAKRFKISDLAIGLTIVAFGTSTPELFVNLFASFQGNSQIAIGNILGSNIANILLILGIAALIYPLKVTKGTVWKEIPLSLLAALMLFVMASDRLIDKGISDILTRSDGLALIAFFIIFLYYTWGIAKEKTEESSKSQTKTHSSLISALMILGGLVLLTLGGQVIINSAISLATAWGVSQAVIGLTIVAVGTSLPELATSAMAAYKRNADIAVGNIVGSNILNIFWILGLSSVIRPLPFSPQNSLDMGMVIFSTVLLFAWLFIGKRRILQPWQGMVFLMVYFAYILILLFSNKLA